MFRALRHHCCPRLLPQSSDDVNTVMALEASSAIISSDSSSPKARATNPVLVPCINRNEGRCLSTHPGAICPQVPNERCAKHHTSSHCLASHSGGSKLKCSTSSSSMEAVEELRSVSDSFGIRRFRKGIPRRVKEHLQDEEVKEEGQKANEKSSSSTYRHEHSPPPPNGPFFRGGGTAFPAHYTDMLITQKCHIFKNEKVLWRPPLNITNI